MKYVGNNKNILSNDSKNLLNYDLLNYINKINSAQNVWQNFSMLY